MARKDYVGGGDQPQEKSTSVRSSENSLKICNFFRADMVKKLQKLEQGSILTLVR